MTQFEWFDFQDQHQAKLKEIRSKPIVLKLGKYECWVENGQIHYAKWIKKQRSIEEFVSIMSNIEDRTYYKDGKWISVYSNHLIFTDKNGNRFRDDELEYWDKQELTKKEWLN